MENIVSEYHAGFYILCPVVGLVFAMILYFRNRKLKDVPRSLIYILASLRFLLATLISFFILGPLLKYLEVDIEPPIVAVVVDNSRSLVLNADSSQIEEQINSIQKELTSRLGNDYELAIYTFGQELREDTTLDFSAPVTDISSVFSSLRDRYANRNLGAVILASDGIFNRGANPRYSTAGLNAPVYTIALGDTTVKRDARIDEVAANRLAFLGNRFPIEARIEADKLRGRSAVLTISRQGREVFREEVSYDENFSSKTVRALLEAKEPGTHRYDLSLSVLNDESTKVNNYRSVFIDVIDARQKILILAAAPHPDIKALREAITTNENYEAEAVVISDFTGNLQEYDLVILHQLPSQTSGGERVMELIQNSDIPFLTVVGSKTSIAALSRIGTGVDLRGYRRTTNDVTGSVNQSFTRFKLPENFNSLLSQAPPVQTPFGDWVLANSAEVVLYQKVGTIATDEPLVIINQQGDKKSASILGEGIWRWRLFDYALNGNHSVFDEFIGGIVQFLSVKEDKRLFRVQNPDVFMENERIVFTAELYNEAYESVNDVEVNILIRDEEGNEYPFGFSRTATAYRLDAGILPVGTYSFKATASRGGAVLTDEGNFTVKEFALEGANLRANHELLYTLSENTGGRMFQPSEASQLATLLTAEENKLKPVSYSTEILSSILNFKWLFYVLLFLLTAEWFLRKRSGNY